MYLEHLEHKLNKYETYLSRQKAGQIQHTEHLPSKLQTQLRKQQLQLVRDNESLKRTLEQKEKELSDKSNELALLRQHSGRTDSINSDQFTQRKLGNNFS